MTLRFDNEYTTAMFTRDPMPEPSSGGMVLLDDARQFIAFAWQQIGSAFNDAKKNSDLSPAGQTRKALTEATAQAKAVGIKVSFALGSAERYIKTLQTDMTPAKPADPAAVAAQVEIRGVLRGMNDGPRMAALMGSLDAGELRLVQAALAAPDFISGLSGGQRAQLIDGLNQALAATNPDHAAAEALKQGVEMLQTAHAQFKSLLCGMAKDAQSAGLQIPDELASIIGYDVKLMRAA